jgi:hypothetical protein
METALRRKAAAACRVRASVAKVAARLGWGCGAAAAERGAAGAGGGAGRCGWAGGDAGGGGAPRRGHAGRGTGGRAGGGAPRQELRGGVGPTLTGGVKLSVLSKRRWSGKTEETKT